MGSDHHGLSGGTAQQEKEGEWGQNQSQDAKLQSLSLQSLSMLYFISVLQQQQQKCKK